MLKNNLFTTSILIGAATAAWFLGCGSNSGGTSSVGSGSSSGGSPGTGSSGSPFNAGSNSGGSSTGSSNGVLGGSSGPSQSGDAGPCMPLSSVPSTNLPSYATVVPMAGACNSMQMSGFMSACVGQGATRDNCVSWAKSNSMCAECIIQSTDAGVTETGAILFSSMGGPVGGNVPGCIALADPTNGPACAVQFEPVIQCVALACAECADQQSFSNCEAAARATTGACAGVSSAAQTLCANDLGSNGVGVTKCGYGTSNELPDVINVICGAGP